MLKVVFVEGKYSLNCEPLKLPDGLFSAMVIVTQTETGLFLSSRRFPDADRFADANAAVACAHHWATDWINKYG